METYLVTGGAGFIGSHVVEALATRGHRVIALDDLSTGARRNLDAASAAPGRVELVEGSVLDEGLVDSCMSEADACFHLAAAVGVQLVIANSLDSLLSNVRGADAVMSAAVRRRRRLVFASTSEIYGKNAGVVREEDDGRLGSPFKARWNYAISKGFGEALAHAYARDAGAEITVARLFNTVGPRQKAGYGMVLPRFVQQALTGADLTVHGSGDQTRCFVHVADTARALLMLGDATGAIGRPFNVGSPEQVTIRELAQKVIAASASSSGIRFVPYTEAYGEGFDELGPRIPDIGALTELTGWRPERTLDQAIADVIAQERAEMAAA